MLCFKSQTYIQIFFIDFLVDCITGGTISIGLINVSLLIDKNTETIM